MMSRALIAMMRLLGWLPLPWLRALGQVLGWLLYALVATRRHVVLTNLRLCFAHFSERQRRDMARRVFVCVAQAWLDRGWLWHGSPHLLRQRLHMTGTNEALQALREPTPLVIFAPHFVGLDAGWTALTQQVPRRFNTIYTDQANKAVDAWLLAGRQRFAAPGLFGRADGVKALVAALRRGEVLYLLPDMNFGRQESVFVPFYGVPAATVPSLSRFARLARARVLPVVTRLTAQGYEVQVHPVWEDFPGADLLHDTALMNQRLQQFIDLLPEQYYWVHKRFKSQPEGCPDLYK